MSRMSRKATRRPRPSIPGTVRLSLEGGVRLAQAFGWAVDLVRHPVTKVYLGVLVALPLYHAAHRLRFVIHHQLGLTAVALVGI